MQRESTTALLLIAVLLLASPAAMAANPDFPNGPDDDPRDAPPDDLNGTWYLLSYIPDDTVDTVRPEEIELGSGIGADRAWQVTLGSAEVVIAVLDSGIFWDHRDLVNKIAVNAGEVPLPDGADVYDANGDGSFDIRDYAGDPRVTDANENGLIDAGDLIRLFSDGVDDDANGYVDDIAGWDFFRGDNDPADDPRFSHGTREAELAAAEGNNGRNSIGVCPRCRVMPVRVGDSFVGDANPFAQGVVFAVDSGASVILEALGTITNTDLAQDAVAYAVDRGVSISASAADENSFHHNFPANYGRVVHVNNLTRDSRESGELTSYMALDACTNWGSKITVSAPSNSCSSGATGIMGGVLGMIHSRGIEVGLDPPLSSAEVFGLVTTTATDIYDDRAETDSGIYPSRPGWDKYFGNGRVDLRAALDAIAPATIPPEAYIEAPEFYGVYDPRLTEVPILGYVAARRAGSYDYTLEAAAGLAPDESDWVRVSGGVGLTRPTGGILGILFPEDVPESKAVARDVTDHHAVLLRLTVTDSLGNRVRYYHQFFLFDDPDWLEPFPVELGVSGESSPVMADLTGDGVFELIIATGGGEVYAFDGDGSVLSGWPVSIGPLPGQDDYLGSAAYVGGGLDPDRSQAMIATPAVADLDGDGEPEVVAASMDGTVGCWHSGGEVCDGFPVGIDPANIERPEDRTESGVLASPLLVDLDADGALEVVVAAMDQRVYAWHADGSPVAGWPVLCRDEASGGQHVRIISSPAAGDMDGDGNVEIVVGSNEDYDTAGRLYAIRAEGNAHPDGPFLPGWPASVLSVGENNFLPYVGEGIASPPSLADFDYDGADEAVVNSGLGFPFIIDGDGLPLEMLFPFNLLSRERGTFEPGMGTLSACYSIADIDGTGRPAIITGGAGLGYGLQLLDPGRRIPGDHLIGAWHVDNAHLLPAFPQPVEDIQLLNGHAVADISGDERPEIVTGSGGMYLHAYDAEGDEPADWPKFTGGWIIATPAVGDMTGDGYLEVAVPTREGYLYVWKTRGRADGEGIQWTSFAHDPQNTGNVATPLSLQSGPTGDDDEPSDDDTPDPPDQDHPAAPSEDDGDDAGCGC